MTLVALRRVWGAHSAAEAPIDKEYRGDAMPGVLSARARVNIDPREETGLSLRNAVHSSLKPMRSWSASTRSSSTSSPSSAARTSAASPSASPTTSWRSPSTSWRRPSPRPRQKQRRRTRNGRPPRRGSAVPAATRSSIICRMRRW